MKLLLENSCELLLLLGYLISTLSSNSGLNYAYYLFAYIFLASYRNRIPLKEILVLLIIFSLLMLGYDLWAVTHLNSQGIGKIWSIIILVLQATVKVGIVVTLVTWRVRSDGV